MNVRSAAPLAVALLIGSLTTAPAARAGNKPERLEWFQDAGLGLFVHWSIDAQLGSVISHSLVGASDDYVRRYIEQLPSTFNPKRFDPDDWAALARLAGMKYVVFTTKHHSGFCMFDTATTDFDIMETPYGRNITAHFVKAFRERGIAVGFYFSPDDFHFLHRHGTTIRRGIMSPALSEYNCRQLRELLTGYGRIDVMFLDGRPEGLKELSWELQPDIVVTRGALETPEQRIPGKPLPGPWESCLTIGNQWQYKPTNEQYKSGTRLIEMLIETRAKGGNLLLNIGPKPDGTIPEEQEARLRELGLWNFVNGEAVYNVRPWVVTNEDDVWFTKAKNADAVYAFIIRTPWKLGEAKTFTLRSVKMSQDTTVSVLGQSGKVLEYKPKVVPETKWHQDDEGLHITATRAQRLYNNRNWPNPIVLKITQAQPAPSRTE